MARGTLGTGMMAPLWMANNFNGPYYAGPSGAAMGALMASQAIADGFRDWGESKGRQQEEARVQAEMDRRRMDELNQRQAVAQAINPYKAAESSGMGNRDMAQRSMLPDAGTQMTIYKMQEDKAAKEQAALDERYSAAATYWYLNGGPQADPNGSNFRRMTGANRSPYEYIKESVYNAAENRDMRRDLAAQSDQTRRELAAAVQAGKTPPTPKRDLFKTPDGGYVYVDEGSAIPAGYEPAKGGAININTGALPTEKAKMVTLAEDGSNSHDVIMANMFDPETGELDRTTATLVRMPGAREGLFGPKVSTVRAALDNAVRAKLRLESGAAIGEKEQAAEDAKYIPGVNDDAATARAKLAPLGSVLKGYVKNSTGKDGRSNNQPIVVPEGYELVNP